MAEIQYIREVAYRIFASEFKESSLELKEKEEDQQSPHYILTPTGAKCNRIFVVGALTEVEDIGKDTQFWRGRVIDPTGVFYVYAGQYQQESSLALSKITPPEFVAVVGKPRIYTTEDGNILMSIMAESVEIVDEQTRNRWVVETAKQTLTRLKKIEKGEEPCALKAKEHYVTDVKQYKEMVTKALHSLEID